MNASPTSANDQTTGPAGTGLPIVRLTEKAARVFRESVEAEGKSIDEHYVRVGANPGGCSGYRYELELIEPDQIVDSEVELESLGIRIRVDHATLTNILGSLEIDYKDQNMVEQGFSFKQLTNGKQCGCGESFTPVKDL